MKVVLAGSTGPVDDPVVAALEAGGAQISRCHHPDDGTMCTMVAGHPCPMDDHAEVAVVPLVAAGAGPTLADGVGCAVRSSIPVVVVGRGSPGPFGAVAAAAADGPDDVVDVCRTAIAGATMAHTRVAQDALEARVDSLGIDADAARELSASVRRNETGLRLEIRTNGLLAHQVGERLGLQVLAAVRAFDPRAKGVSLAVI